MGTVRLTLYNVSDSPKTVSKTLGSGVDYDGAFTSDSDNPSDRDPIIRIGVTRASLGSLNYAYIPDFGAYYFIKEKRAVHGTMTELVMHKDVLKTFDAGIRAHDAIIRRQASSSVGNVNLDDEMFVVERCELETGTLSNYGGHSATIVLGVTGTM